MFLSKLGRVEKSVEADTGAVLATRWCGDYTALVSGVCVCVRVCVCVCVCVCVYYCIYSTCVCILCDILIYWSSKNGRCWFSLLISNYSTGTYLHNRHKPQVFIIVWCVL